MWKPGQIVTVAGKICRIKRRLPISKGGHLGCLSGCAFAKHPRWTGVCRSICHEQWYDNLHSKLPTNCYFEEIRRHVETRTNCNSKRHSMPCSEG